MDDRAPDQYYNTSCRGLARMEPVRSRWTPKPEQILILEHIFNSGMVNPPKDETVRIRKMLEEFGSVGDANVFYWFQNRRSRSRRQQQQQRRQAQSVNNRNNNGSTSTTTGAPAPPVGAIKFESISTSSSGSTGSCSSSPLSSAPPPSNNHEALSTADIVAVNHLSSKSHQMAIQEIDQQSASAFGPYDSSMMNSYRPAGYVIVFINEVPTEVPSGPFDLKAMFGEDLMLVHPSGLPVPCNSHGIILQSLQAGESYFLVPKPT